MNARNININADWSAAPNWLIDLLLGGTLAAAVLDAVRQPASTSESITINQCYDLCYGWIVSYGPNGCACEIPSQENE